MKGVEKVVRGKELKYGDELEYAFERTYGYVTFMEYLPKGYEEYKKPLIKVALSQSNDEGASQYVKYFSPLRLKKKYYYKLDGNMYCCTVKSTHKVNIQEQPAGFGKTEPLALKALLKAMKLKPTAIWQNEGI